MGKNITKDCQKKLEQIQKFCESHPHRGSIHFSEIASYLTADVLAVLGARNPVGISLLKLNQRICVGSKIDFWYTIFRSRSVLPKETLLEIWYECYNERSQYMFVDTENGRMYLGKRSKNPRQLVAHPITDPLLIDNFNVSTRYCQAKKTGWEVLRYRSPVGRRSQSLACSDPLISAIQDDSVPEFCMMMNMTGRQVSFSLLYAIIKEQHAFQIFRYLLLENLIPERVISLAELSAWFTMEFDDKDALTLLSAIEEKQPGFLKSFRDVWGRNLLWYVTYNSLTIWFHPDCRLTNFLLDCGCDQENENQLGLSWYYIKVNLPIEKKLRQMKRRYDYWEATRIDPDDLPSGPNLKIDQSIPAWIDFENKSSIPALIEDVRQ